MVDWKVQLEMSTCRLLEQPGRHTSELTVRVPTIHSPSLSSVFRFGGNLFGDFIGAIFVADGEGVVVVLLFQVHRVLRHFLLRAEEKE